MDSEKMLIQIINKLTSIENEISNINLAIEEVKLNQLQHTQQLTTITEQTAKNSELQSAVDEIAKDVQKLKDDNVLIKRVLAN